MISIRVLGELEVGRDGEPAPLPQSRKTRALLAYLASTPRKHSRERLCELFWNIPDDPKGSLRWSLSKLRPLLDVPETPGLVADRQGVSLDRNRIEVDLEGVRKVLTDGVDAASTADLRAAAARFRGPFCADLDLPAAPEFQLWLVSAREAVAQLRRQILDALCDRLAADEALPYLRERVAAQPEDEAAWAALVATLAQLGRRSEAQSQYEAAQGALAGFGIAAQMVERALRTRPPAREAAPAAPAQEIRFCRVDGVRIAFAVAGDGPPLVKAANWLNHLEFDWESPIWGHFLHGLAENRRLLRYDARGNGLSDWEAGELSLDAWVRDLEAVVDEAGFERFPLLGVSQGCAISIAYAVRHPERVSHLVLYGGFAAGAYMRGDPETEIEKRRAMTTLIRLGWGQDNPAFRQMFTSTFIPDATREQADAFNELQRRTTSPECAARYMEATARLDVRGLLAQVTTPTLVMHRRGDADAPVEFGRQMAAGIPGARFVPLTGQNHLFLEGEPAEARFFEEMNRFLADDVTR